MKYYVIDSDNLWRVLNQRRLKNLTNDGQKIEPTSVKKFNTNNKRENNKREVIKENNTVLDSNLSEPVKQKLIDFLEYRKESKKPYKSERAIKTLVTQVEKQERLHGASAVISCIDKSIANGWQGLFWDKAPKPEVSKSVQHHLDIESWGKQFE